MLPVDYRRLKSYGGTPLESKLNDIVDAIQTNALNNGVGYSVASSANGSYIKLAPSAPANYYPFQVLDATTNISGTLTRKARVVFGQVITQTNNSEGQVMVIPSGMNIGDSPPFIVNVTDNGYINLQVTTDSSTYNVNTGVAMPVVSFTTSTPGDSTFVANLILGSVSTGVNNVLISQFARDNIGFINALGIPVWY